MDRSMLWSRSVFRLLAGMRIAGALLALGCGGQPLDPESPPVAPGGAETQALTAVVLNPPVIINPPKLACGVHLLSLPGRFDFDAGGTDGWQVSGLFDGDTANHVATIGPAAAPFWDPEDAGGSTSSTDGRGSAAVLAALAGLPSAPSGWWREDFVSPDLSSNGGWQFGTISFAVKDDITFDGPALQAQLVLEVAKCDGTVALRRPVDAAGNPVFCAVPRHAGWGTCSAQVDLTGVDHVRHVNVRIFGRSGFGYEGMVLADQVRAQ